MRYAGYYYDTDTEKYYLKNRYYDGTKARFLTEDPYWNVSNMLYGNIADDVARNVYYPAVVQSGNRFAYCMGNPVNWSDPLGLVVTAWDKAHLNDEEIKLLEELTDQWERGNRQGNTKMMEDAHSIAEQIRDQYRENGEHGFDDGNTGTNGKKYSQDIWGETMHPGNSVTASSGSIKNVVGIAATTALADSPALGPGDLVALGIVTIVGLSTIMPDTRAQAETKYGTIGYSSIPVQFSKKSKQSDKEKANDIPSWAKGEKPQDGESGNDYAKRVMDKKYGEGNYKTGPGSEYNKLRKYGDRGARR